MHGQILMKLSHQNRLSLLRSAISARTVNNFWDGVITILVLISGVFTPYLSTEKLKFLKEIKPTRRAKALQFDTNFVSLSKTVGDLKSSAHQRPYTLRSIYTKI